MDNERYVAAIEIGSSKIIAAAGRTDGTGLDILAVEQIKCTEMVRYGIIQNPQSIASSIATLIDRLQNRAEISPRKITSLFTGISGRSMRSIPVDVSINLHEEREITAADLEALRRQASESAIDSSLRIIEIVPRIYKVGKTRTHTPEGMLGSHVEATFDLIVCRPMLERNLRNAIEEKLGLSAEYIVTPLAMSYLMIKPDEKRSGCMLVDMGAETTTVVIFKNGSMVYFATIPLGSRNITIDLMSMNLSEEKAEAIKQQSGKAISPDNMSNITIEGLRLRDITGIVVARAEEIAANICEQISYAGLEYNDLPGGIIAVGEGFKLSGMTELVAEQCNLSVRLGKLPDNGILLEDNKAPAGDLLQVASVLYSGATHSDLECLEEEEERDMPIGDDEPEPDYYDDDQRREAKPRKPEQPQRPSFLSHARDWLAGIIKYGEDSDNDTELN